MRGFESAAVRLAASRLAACYRLLPFPAPCLPSLWRSSLRPATLLQRLQYAKTKSDAVAKLDNTYKKEKKQRKKAAAAAAAGEEGG